MEKYNYVVNKQEGSVKSYISSLIIQDIALHRNGIKLYL